MAQVLDWSNARHCAGLARHAAQRLRSGELVAFPTESAYALAALPLAAPAVARLAADAGPPVVLALGHPGTVPDWVPGLGNLGRRLIRRCWPGPVALAFPEVSAGLAGRLPADARSLACPSETLCVRVVAHEALLQTLARLPAPLLLAEGGPDGPVPRTAAEAAERFGERVALVIDAGPRPPDPPPTVAEVRGERWEVAREGAVSREELSRLTACVVLFLCTGNTCRSPMSEALCKRLLAARMGCGEDELAGRGFWILSAGLAAARGDAATAEAQEVVREWGADLSRHVSRPVSPDLLAQADYLVAMTEGHRQALTRRFSGLPVRPRLLCEEGADLPDPIGGDQAVYRACARTIFENLQRFVAEVYPG